MKRILLGLFIFTGVSGYAQGVHLGLKGGVNVSNFTGGDFGNLKNKAIVAYHLGTYVNIGLGALSLQPELLISSQGAKLDSATGSENWKVTYLGVPVMVKYRMQSGFYIEAGPQVSFKLSEDIESQTIKEFAQNLDLSAGLGFGIQAKSGLGIGARYMAGLSKVGDFKNSTINPDFKNGVLQLSIMLGLNSGK